jgi:phage tail-like protein
MPPAVTTDPSVAVCFGLVIDRHDLGAFVTCDGLSVQIKIDEVPEGGNNLFVHQLPGRISYQHIKLTRPINADSAKVRAWLASMNGQIKRTTAEITAMTADGKRVTSWGLIGVIPVRWQGPSFSAESPSVATETLEFAHHGFIK